MDIRRANEADFESMWPIFRAVVSTGTTYVFDPETSREEAFAYWLGPGVRSWVAEDGGRVVGMYKIVANQRDLGSCGREVPSDSPGSWRAGDTSW